MRVSRIFLIAAAVAAAAYLLRSHRPVEAQANLIVNGGFDSAQGDVPFGWNLDGAVKNKGSIRLNGGTVELTPNGRNGDANKPFGIGQLVSAANLRGKRVAVKASMKVTGGATAQFIAFAITNDFRPLGNVVLAESGESSQFQEKSDSLEVSPEAANVLVGCVVIGKKGTASFDNVSMEIEGAGAAVPATPPPPTGASGTDSASIDIEAGTVLRPVPKLLYGTNLEWIRDANGLWDPRSESMHPSVLEAARDAGITLVRFPGGIFADYYHWRDGVGPRQNRPVRPHVADDGRSGNGFGIHELMDFCRRIGAEPLLQVNIITGTPEEAAAWVSYCNDTNHDDRARNGSKAPFRVRYWEIGNEQYGRADNKNIAKSSLTAAEYTNRYRKFAQAMRAADPTIRLVGVGGLNTRKYEAVTDNNWNKVLLTGADPQMDYLAVHNAYGVLAASSARASFDEVYKTLLAFPELIAENLSGVNRQIESYGGGKVKIAITEWGPWFHAIPSDPWVGHAKTLGSALFTASAMQTFLRDSRTEMANFFKLTEGSFLGSIDPVNGPKPVYYALQMYSKHFGDLVLDTRASGPVFSSRDIGNVAGVSRAPYLDALASLSQDRSRMYLMAVNKNQKALRTQIRIQGFRPSGAAKSWVLTAPSLDANNGQDLPSIPGLTWAKQAQAPKNPMFEKGRPGLVVPRESPVSGVSGDFVYEFAPISLTAIEFSRSR